MIQNLLVLLLVSFQISPNCTCLYETPEQHIKDADIIFIGKVVSIDTLNGIHKSFVNDSSIMSYDGPYFTNLSNTFLIKKIYKGKIATDTIQILTENSGADCGFHFTLGKRYIVYANDEEYLLMDQPSNRDSSNIRLIFETSTCTRTTADYVPEEKLLKSILKKMNK